MFDNIKAALYREKTTIKLHNKISNLKTRKLIDAIRFPSGICKYLSLNFKKTKEKETYNSNFAICSMFKNEGRYIKEWIDYHLKIGVDKFYLYNNDSSDNYLDVLDSYIKKGVVELTNIHGNIRLFDAYNDVLNKHKNDCKYLAIIDIDEFLFFKEDSNIFNIVDKCFNEFKNCGGLSINWCIFGSSNLEKMTNEYVTKRFLYRSETNFEKNQHCKTIINPRKVIGYCNPHFAVFLNKYHSYNLSGEIIKGPYNKNFENQQLRLNHYFTKSKDEYILKKKRGRSDINTDYDMQGFIEHDKNDVFDDSILKKWID